VLSILKPELIQRILVRGPNWVGDAVMCTPALGAIRQRFPAAEISLLARPAVANLLSGHTSLDQTIVYEHQGQHAGFMGRFRLAKYLKTLNFDLAVLFPNSLDAALLAFLAKIPRRYGYSTDGRSVLLTDAISLSANAKQLHQVQYYEELIRPLCPTYSSKAPRLSISQSEKDQANQLLLANAVPKDCLLIGLNPGSMYGEAKRWLPERFAEAADQLVEMVATNSKSMAEAKCLILGAPGEEELGHQIAKLMKTHPVVLSGQTTLGSLKAVVQRCQLFLTNDTGPMHIASALGVPVVAVFGPTDHTTTSPYASGHVVVRTSVDCSPCLLRECPIDHRCMTGVTVEQVVQRAQQVLQGRNDSLLKPLRVES
jgi:heptosyltransferase-2